MERLQRRRARQKHHVNAVVFALDIVTVDVHKALIGAAVKHHSRVFYRGFFLYQRGVSAVHAE